MKKEKKLVLKLMLMIALGLALPAISSAPNFISYATDTVQSDGGNGPSDNGGQKPIESPKGSGSSLDRLIEAARNALGGLLGGYITTDDSRSA